MGYRSQIGIGEGLRRTAEWYKKEGYLSLRNRSNRIYFLSLLVILVAVGLRLTFFKISITYLPASADEAQGVLTSKNITRGELPLLITGSPYQFPIESYLLNPLVHFMPRNAFGARYIAVFTGLMALIGFLGIVRRLSSPRQNWPGIVLLLFPSAYWLLWQVAYIPTNYNPALMLSCFGLLLTLLSREKKDQQSWILVLSGILLGLAFCSILLMLPILLMAGAFIFFGENWRKGLRGTFFFLVGLAIGLMPYFFASWLIPGANQAVSGSYSWAEALKRAWPLVQNNLPVAMGIRPCLYPDFKATLTLIPGIALPFTITFFLILGIVTIARGSHHLRELPKKNWLSLRGIDIFIGISWLSLFFFALSRRSHQHTYRYLLPLVWSFPFLIGYLYTLSSRRVRVALGAGVILLSLFNLATGVALMRTWADPRFASTQADMPDLRPAIACLDRLEINRCYASMWMASRIAYETDERILCSQPYNTRFYGWPIPYKEKVDASRKVAYVLTHSDRFTSDRFDADLKAMEVSSRRDPCGEFFVYYDFQSKPKEAGTKIPGNQFMVRTSHNPQAAGFLHDGLKNARWGSHHPQEKGMWIEMALSSPQVLSGLDLTYNQYAHDMAPSIKVLVRKNNKWTALLASVPGKLDGFAFLNGHPVYGDKMQTISLPATKTDALRLEIVDPNPKQDWSLVEIGIYQRDAK